MPLTFSDHRPILTTITPVSGSLKRFGKAKWKWDSANWDKYSCISERRFRIQLEKSLTLDEEMKRFTQIVQIATRRSVPKGNLRGNIWWSTEAAAAIEERTTAFQMYERDKTPENFAIFSIVQNNTDLTVAKSQRTCWGNNATNMKADKNGWSLISAIDGRRRSGASKVEQCGKSNQDLADDIVKKYVAKKETERRKQTSSGRSNTNTSFTSQAQRTRTTSSHCGNSRHPSTHFQLAPLQDQTNLKQVHFSTLGTWD